MKLVSIASAFLSLSSLFFMSSPTWGQDPVPSCGSGGIIFEEREPIDPTNPEDWLPLYLNCGRGAYSSTVATVTCVAPNGPSRAIIGPVGCGLSRQMMIDQCLLNATNGNDISTTEGACVAAAWTALESSLPCQSPTCPRCLINTSKVCKPMAVRSRSFARGAMPAYNPSMQPLGGGMCNIDCGLQDAVTYTLTLYAYCSQYCDSQPCSLSSTRPR